MVARILRLNKLGMPMSWLSREEAATLYVKGQVIWYLGENSLKITGGWNKDGERSVLHMASIIACDGFHDNDSQIPALSNPTLFRRDNHRCMYCGYESSDKELTRDHVIPRVQGGRDIWSNVVAACKRCNNHKGGNTPEQANMELLAIPFQPNIFEYMYLSNRQILGDQMEYLESRFSTYRQWQAA